MLRSARIMLWFLILVGCDSNIERSTDTPSHNEDVTGSECSNIGCDELGCASNEKCSSDLVDMLTITDLSNPTRVADASLLVDIDIADAMDEQDSTHMSDRTDMADIGDMANLDDLTDSIVYDEQVACDDSCNGALTGTENLCVNWGPSGVFTRGTLGCNDECLVDTTNCVRPDQVEHEPCQFHLGWPRGECAEGLVCAANGLLSPAREPYYDCLRTCQGADDTTTCGEDYICVTPETDGSNLANGFEHVCVQGPFEREDRCDNAPGVCGTGLQCLPTGHPEGGLSFFLGPRSQCKLTCPLEGANTCPSGENCFPDPLGYLNPQDGVGLCGNAVAPCSWDISVLEWNWLDPPMSRETVNWFIDTFRACSEVHGQCSIPEGSGHNYCDRPVSGDSTRPMNFSTCVENWTSILAQDLKSACIKFCENDLDCGNGTVCARPAIPISRNTDHSELAGMPCGTIFGLDHARCQQIEVAQEEMPYGCYLFNSETAVCARARKQCVLQTYP